MPKSLIFILVFTLIIAPGAPNFTYKVALAQDGSLESSQTENPAGKSLLQEEIQKLMEKAQNKLQEGTSKVYQSAQEAAQSEIQRQAEKQVQATKGALTAFVKKVADTIKENIAKAISKIKNFLWEKFHFKTFAPKEKSAK